MVSIETADGRRFVMDGYLNTLLDGFHNAVMNRNTSSFFIVDGRSGMGKTTLAVQCAFKLKPDFNIDSVFFSAESFLNSLAKAKKGDVLIFDEAMTISNRSSLSELNRVVVASMSMIRSKQLFIIFCVNSIFDLDRNIALSRADVLIHVFGDNIADRGNFTAFFKPKGNHECKIKQLYLLGKKMYSYSRPRANFHGTFYGKFLIDEVEYEKRKQVVVNQFLQKTPDKLQIRNKMLINLILYLKKSENVPKIAEVADVSEKTIYNLINKYEPQNQEYAKTPNISRGKQEC